MIGSFWNLCRACPSMPVDKLHSEYRSTYRWHEYTGSRQDVVRRPPQPNATSVPGENQTEKLQSVRLKEEDGQNEGSQGLGRKMEPAMPRRKKHPELAYKTHEFLTCDEEGSNDSIDASVRADRARDGGGLLRKAISRISTEYRLQFAWPPGHNSRADMQPNKDGSLPRKSLSMGAIKPSAQAMVHKKRSELDTKDVSELEPLVNDVTVNEEINKDDKLPQKSIHTDYKKKFRPFSQYDYIEPAGRLTHREPEHETLIEKNENGPNMVLYPKPGAGWYKEVVELRKKAGEYKHRGWGTELAPEHISELYNKQIELWDQVSRRSSLSALSLASTTHRSFTKEEKEQENNKKNSPTKGMTNGRNILHRKGRDSTDTSTKVMKDMIRHHLERTTGGTEYDGLILSPTREKLEPTTPKKNEDLSKGKDSPQKASPKKDSPQKSAANKKSAQKLNSKPALRTTRSQSVGPTDVTEKRSPKRLSRSTTVKQPKTNRESASSPPSSTTVRRPRPSDSSVQDKTTTVAGGELLGSEVPSSATPLDREPDIEHVVKSPPEPTRVKSPEQIMMRSPDPVNWTVPLDTGKTFTVTQNVREGELMNRPHSEVKAWTPPDVPPPAAQSAPPELAEQAKAQGSKTAESSTSSVTPLQEVSVTSASEITIINGDKQEDRPQTSSVSVPSSTVSKIAGTNLRCLDDPMSDAPPIHQQPTSSSSTGFPYQQTESTSDASPESSNPGPYKVLEAPPMVSPTSASGRSLASEVLEKARTRFDKFWGKSKQDSKDDNI